MKTFLLGIITLFFLVKMVNSTSAQSADSTANPMPIETTFGLFVRDSILQLTIESDFGRFRRQKKLKKWQPAIVKFIDRTGISQELSVEIRPGGVSRQEACNWPPLKIRFPGVFLDAAGVHSKKPVELFLVCYEADQYRQYLMLEYAAYQLYAIMTERCFRTQLAKIQLFNSEKGCIELADFAFLVEHPDEFAARIGGRRLQPKVMSPTVLQEDVFDVVCLFEFMIGNTDWYPHNNHNIEFFGIPGGQKPVPVPYDFDYSGFVDPPYAFPHPAVPIGTVRDRYFQGLCRENGELQKTIQLFIDRKPELLAFCRTFPHFTERTRKDALKYIEGFFSIIENPKKTEKQILRVCDEWFKKPKN